MEKLIKKISLSYIVIILILGFSQIGFAVTTNDLLPPPGDAPSQISGGYDQIKAVKDLPDVSIEGIAATAIKTLLGWSMIIALVGIVIAGIYMLIFQGDSGKVEKAKNVLQYLIIGEIVVSVAYGIVNGIIQFKFFT